MTHRRTTVEWPAEHRAQFRARRLELGLRQDDVARLSGVPQPKISRWERNDLDLPMSRIISLHRALRMGDQA
jgi:predicted transcriptional regulator